MLEKTIRKTYQEACEAMRQKEYQKARFYFDEVRQSAPTYRSVNYFLAKCAFVLNEAEENIYPLVGAHLATETTKNRKAAYQLALKTAVKFKNETKLADFLEQAKADAVPKLEPFAETLAKWTGKVPMHLRFKFIQFAKNKTPIAKTSHPKYRAYKFFINGMSEHQKKHFATGKWQELAVTKPKFLEFKGYMSCSIRDERTYYRKYLPKFPDLFLRSVFNDHLEEDEFFKSKWERSRVFSLLQIPAFDRPKIAELLELNDLLDETAKRHLKGCDDLVYLKKAGEVLPESQAADLSELKLLKEFGYLCKKNCGHTLHLADKCQYERNFNQLLGRISRRKLPLVHPPKTYRPTKEQFDFLKWLAQNKHVVINLLGVGGSGKTYTLGQILDPKKTLALAPTHKARLNLAQHGFFNNDTLQHVIYEIENGNEELINDYEVIIIDEVSMAPLELLAKLTQTFSTKVRYLLVGDEKQLPPVSQDEDALSVCGDPMALIKAKGACFYFRANLRCKDKATGELIAACRAGNSSYLAHSQAFKTATGKEMVLAKYQHEALEECMILAYRNKTVGLINQQFYRILSKDKQKVVPFYFQNGLGRGGFFIGAKVVFYHNDDSFQNYGYTNSEFGEVIGLELKNDDEDSAVTVQTEVGKYKLPLYRAKKDLLLAYALTIHKAQGSGAKRVYVLEPKDHGLAYTAVSRAKQELFFVGVTRDQLLKGVQTETPKKKNLLDLMDDKNK